MSNQPRVVTNSIAAIAAGFGAFFAAGGVVFGAMYVVFFYVLPKPTEWATLVNNGRLALSYVIGVALGSAVGGYVIARIARRNQFVHSAAVASTLIALVWWYTQPYDGETVLAISLATVLLCLLFFLATWMGSRKRKQIERSE